MQIWNLRISLINIVYTILFCCSIQFQAKAKTYYCWAISGLLVRAEPFTDSKVIGKIEYGQKIDITHENRHKGIFH